MKVLLDACVPHWLRSELRGCDATTARDAGLDRLPDGQLLAAIEGRFDVLVTLDRNLPYQQNLAQRPFAVIVLRVRDQTPEAFRALAPVLVQAIAEARAGQVRVIA